MESERKKIDVSVSFAGEVQGEAVTFFNLECNALGLREIFVFFNRNDCKSFFIQGGPYFKETFVSSCGDGEGDGRAVFKVFEAGCGAVHHVGDVLKGIVFPIGSLLREGGIAFFEIVGADAQVVKGSLPGGQVAGDERAVAAFGKQRSVIESAGGHFGLSEGFVFVADDRFGNSLPRVGGIIGLAVAENIEAVFDGHKRSVVVSGIGDPVFFTDKADVAVVMQDPFVVKGSLRMVRDGVAELVGIHGRIDEIVQIIKFAQGGCFQEIVAGVGDLADFDALNGRLNGVHVFFQLYDIGTRGKREGSEFFFQKIPGGVRGKADVEINMVFFDEDGGVKGIGIQRPLADESSFLVFDMIQERKGSFRLIRDSDADRPCAAGAVVKVVSVVLSLNDVRGKEGMFFFVEGILFLSVDDAMIRPLGKIFDVCRVEDVVVFTEGRGAEAVVGAIEIEPVSEKAGFAIGDVLVIWQVGVEGLFFHGFNIAHYVELHEKGFFVENGFRG